MTLENRYESPLATRYASEKMNSIFSPHYKYSTWRKLWIALARAQKSLGLSISSEQIDELESNVTNIDFDLVKEFEKKYRHEVMAHIYAFAKACPKAASVLHLGATSAFVMDNTDMIQIKNASLLIKCKMLTLLKKLKDFCIKNKGLVCIGYTHFQPAQPTTIGKRFTLYLQDFLEDFKDLDRFISSLAFYGVKGATGTQATSLTLFEGNTCKARELDLIVAKEMDFASVMGITSQTYPRKLDMRLLNILACIGASSHKMANDIRLLSHTGEIAEPFEKDQIGSSAMPFKKNPMRSERVCSLSRHLMSLASSAGHTAALQWLERSLDDSAQRRITIPEAFLTVDAIINTLGNMIPDLVIDAESIENNLKKYSPYLSMETHIIKDVIAGKDRQEAHEKYRQMALSETFPECLDPKTLSGLAEMQVETYIENVLNPILEKNAHFAAVLPSIEI